MFELEHKLRETRENEEAVEALLADKKARTKRLEKVERLKIAWKKKMEIKEFEQILRKLENLTVTELDGDMIDI